MDEESTSGSGGIPPDELRDQFIGWQCRLRQLAVREGGGRPSSGMQPRVSADSSSAGGDERDKAETMLDQLVVLIVERAPGETTAHLRHLCRRTQDPRDRQKQALTFLSAGYYQYPNRFDDAMTALFAPNSSRARLLAELGKCALHFEQYSRAYWLPCAVRSLRQEDAAYQATLYHNTAFNSGLPPNPEILAFAPDWGRASTWQTAEP